jgi:uncharacterized membrane protein
MTTWIMNAVGLFLTTVGALLIFLYLWRAPRLADEFLSEQARSAYSRNRNLLIVAVGLLSVWFLVQCLAVILL